MGAAQLSFVWRVVGQFQGNREYPHGEGRGDEARERSAATERRGTQARRVVLIGEPPDNL